MLQRSIRSAIITLLLLSTFRLLAADKTPQIESPSGGELYVEGSVQDVSLAAKNKFKRVIIELSRDGGVSFSEIGIIDNTTIKDKRLKNRLEWTVSAPV